jgi:hypothetical protein
MSRNSFGQSCAATALMIASILVQGCTGVTTLSDGRNTTLDTSDAKIRSDIQVTRVPLTDRLAYIPVKSCTYKQEEIVTDGRKTDSETHLEIKPVRDRLLITEYENGKPSTALIGRNGHIYNFNLYDSDLGTRSDKSTFGEQAAARVEKAREKGGLSAHELNPLTMVFPEFLQERPSPGDIVANVEDEDGAIWGRYQYAGITNVSNRRAAVFDLRRVLETQPDKGNVVVGYDVVDVSNGLPLKFVLHVGARMQFEQVQCASSSSALAGNS